MALKMNDIELLDEQEDRLDEVARPFAEYVVDQINSYCESQSPNLWEQMYLRLRILAIILARNQQ